jgi:hypothetical protein
LPEGKIDLDPDRADFGCVVGCEVMYSIHELITKFEPDIQMTKTVELAEKYMASFYGAAPLSSMASLLADDLYFRGPFGEFHSAQAYLDSLN